MEVFRLTATARIWGASKRGIQREKICGNMSKLMLHLDGTLLLTEMETFITLLDRRA